jgi:hypothetical protein
MAGDKNAVIKAFGDIGARVAARTRSYYLLSYCSPARAGKHEVRIEAVFKGSQDGGDHKGSLRSDFDATGFLPGCDPNVPPTFDLTKGDALAPPEKKVEKKEERKPEKEDKREEKKEEKKEDKPKAQPRPAPPPRPAPAAPPLPPPPPASGLQPVARRAYWAQYSNRKSASPSHASEASVPPCGCAVGHDRCAQIRDGKTEGLSGIGCPR